MKERVVPNKKRVLIPIDNLYRNAFNKWKYFILAFRMLSVALKVGPADVVTHYTKYQNKRPKPF
jgi:hypothetical protein